MSLPSPALTKIVEAAAVVKVTPKLVDVAGDPTKLLPIELTPTATGPVSVMSSLPPEKLNVRFVVLKLSTIGVSNWM